MRALSQGEDAFYLSLYVDHNRPILWVTNVGSANVLDLSFLSNHAHPLVETKDLAVVSTEDLNSLFGIDLVAVEN